MRRVERTKESLKVARAALEAETQEVVRASKNLNENLGKAARRTWRQLLFLWAIVAVLAISYLWVVKHTPKTANLANVPPPPPASPGAPGTLPPPPLASQLTPDVIAIPAGEDLVKLLNQIREAQLKKDIRLFLNSYSPNFTDLKQKKELTLNIWRRYDYIDLRFHLSNVKQEDPATIIAQVDWNIKALDHKTDDVKTLTKNYQVHFSKESSGKWLIKKLETIDEKQMEK